MTFTDAQIEDLLQRARAGDEAAFASLIAAVHDRVQRWALVITRDYDDAEDVTQQVSITLHRKLHDFEERSRFTTWLYAVVRNAAIELTRKASRRHERQVAEDALAGELSDDVENRLGAMENQRAAALVRSYFTELPARQRELIELIDQQECTVGEAAGLMDIQPATARVHLLRARRTIRARMLALHPEMVP